MKVTRKMLESRVYFLNQNLNRPLVGWSGYGPHGTLKANIGHFHLNANNPGDGWTRYSLEETVTEGGGVHQHFFGNNQDMWAYLRGVDDALRLKSFSGGAQ